MKASRIRLAAASMLAVFIATGSLVLHAQSAKSELLEAANRFNMLMAKKDIAIVNECAPDADILFQGSGAGELSVGPEQMKTFWEGIIKGPRTISFDWTDTRATAVGDVGWVHLIGEMVNTADGKTTRRPYRITGILQKRNGVWKWRLFHGSQAPPPAPPQASAR